MWLDRIIGWALSGLTVHSALDSTSFYDGLFLLFCMYAATENITLLCLDVLE